MKKRLLFAFMAILTTISAFADWQDPETKVNYSTGYNFSFVTVSPDATGDITIRSSIMVDGKEYDVLGIGNTAFSSCSGLTSVVIPNSVMNIGVSAFMGCI